MGAQQQTRRTPLSIDGTDRRTDGRTTDCYIDPAPHAVQAESVTLTRGADVHGGGAIAGHAVSHAAVGTIPLSEPFCFVAVSFSRSAPGPHWHTESFMSSCDRRRRVHCVSPQCTHTRTGAQRRALRSKLGNSAAVSVQNVTEWGLRTAGWHAEKKRT